MTYVWIALGSALGGMARHWCSGFAMRHLGESFPWGTLLVNVLGSLVIGLVAALAASEGRFLLPSDARLFVMVGVLGGFTTFSAFSLQTLALLQAAQWLYAGANIVGSVLLCLLFVWAGYALGSVINR
jgi:CrcB protein